MRMNSAGGHLPAKPCPQRDDVHERPEYVVRPAERALEGERVAAVAGVGSRSPATTVGRGSRPGPLRTNWPGRLRNRYDFTFRAQILVLHFVRGSLGEAPRGNNSSKPALQRTKGHDSMTFTRMAATAAVALLAIPWSSAQAGGWRVGIGVGIGFPIYRPSYPVYVVPAPVYYVQPAPVYAQPAPVYTSPTPFYLQPVPTATPAPQTNIERLPPPRSAP
jgi:hypothetical protein